jgi:hypothetical protein
MSGRERKSSKNRKKDSRDWKKYNEDLVVRVLS